MPNNIDKLVIAKITQKARAGYTKIKVLATVLAECSKEGLTAIKEMQMAWEIKIIVT
ncbi:hypothetical protein [uncultured Algibacter sp.]|uniref:hypothetical protein n=1 Tax=uncultured Algibacter sp. TaxID=298659 RepID=UPI002620F5A8|nr:hypothetical protein [uncultured Algibacter sp.]